MAAKKKTKSKKGSASKRKNAVRLIEVLGEVGPSVRKVAADSIPGRTIGVLSHCIRDILQGNPPLAPDQHEALKPYRKQLKKFASRRSNLTTKRALLKSGGFLRHLVAPPRPLPWASPPIRTF